MSQRVKVGVVGCGVISDIYIRNLQERLAEVEVVAVSDALVERAEQRAQQYGVPQVLTTEELIASPDVQLVVNLTIPSLHAAISRAALNAGKHVYTEKPLGVSFQEGAELVELAYSRGLMLACAPDTILGANVQTGRRLLDDGVIGEPIGARAHFMWAGPESWHPDPAFLYKKGAGPLFDTGPYFVSALAYLLGPIANAFARGSTPFAERTITSEPKYGERIQVEVPTYVEASFGFLSGAIASLILSADIPSSRFQDPEQNQHAIEIYGTKGVLSLPSPCHFGGRTYLREHGARDWSEVPPAVPYTDDWRGIGIADMAGALLHRRAPRLTPELALHVLRVLTAVDASFESQAVQVVGGDVPAGDPLPKGVAVGLTDVGDTVLPGPGA